MKFNRKIEILFNHKTTLILDSQSQICNSLYNELLEKINLEYKNNPKDARLLKGRNLRNLIPILKQSKPYLKTVYSSPLKNVAFRLLDAYKQFLKGERGYPKFRSQKKKWFSLLYDESFKGYKLRNRQLLLSLGKNQDNKQIRVTGSLKEILHLKETDLVKTFRLCKQHGRFYGIFCIERETPETKEVKTWLAIDPNHKNFFVGINHKGESIEFKKLTQSKYFDTIIDELKSKRDQCKKFSKRWRRLNKTINRVAHRRREQIKSLCFTIANYLAKHYDCVMIGDYSPSVKVAPKKNMRRSVLNQSTISSFRKILEWVFLRSGKDYRQVNEYNTTKACCKCGHKKKKDPEIRMFRCTQCHHTLNRDINSSVNIAKKGTLLSGSDYVNWDLSHVTYTAEWNYRQSRILFTGYVAQNVA